MVARTTRAVLVLLTARSVVTQTNTSQSLRGSGQESTHEDSINAIVAAFNLDNSSLSAQATSRGIGDSQLRSCGTRCFGRRAGDARVDCISSCLGGSSCAQCYGAASDCTMSHCLSKCMTSSSSEKCKTCTRDHHCGPC